jgi:N-dimethylarginine dimethylaminohydrolase
VALLQASGAEVLFLPQDERTTLDALYAHDPVLVTEAGAIILQAGKLARRSESIAFEAALAGWGVPVLGRLDGVATAEGGDLLWLNAQTLLAGRGFRTNALGIAQLTSLLKPLGVNVLGFDLPYWKGPADVLHLMSFISLLDIDLAVVYRRLLPAPLYEVLQARGVHLVDVPDEEYDSVGCNVLAVAPRRLIMVSGNPVTKARLEAVGCSVTEFDGQEICLPGAGGPTCLTRPLQRG